eukprot:3901616-Pyramimonas_sp.AAC.1
MLAASDWSVMRIYPCFLRLIGPTDDGCGYYRRQSRGRVRICSSHSATFGKPSAAATGAKVGLRNKTGEDKR